MLRNCARVSPCLQVRSPLLRIPYPFPREHRPLSSSPRYGHARHEFCRRLRECQTSTTDIQAAPISIPQGFWGRHAGSHFYCRSKERAASLVWLRQAVANNIPPDTWSSLLAPALLTDVRGLFPIPPAKAGADPAKTNLHHLARVFAPFMPHDPPVGTAPPLPPTAPAKHGAPLAEASTLSCRRVHRAHPQLPRPRNHPAHPHHHRPSRQALVPPRRSGSGRCTTICMRPSPTTSIQPSTLAPTYLWRNAPMLQEACKKSSSGARFRTAANFFKPLQLEALPATPATAGMPRVARPLRRLHTCPWYCLRRTTIPRTRRHTLASRPGP